MDTPQSNPSMGRRTGIGTITFLTEKALRL